MLTPHGTAVHPTVSAVAVAFADWIDAVEATRAEIRAELTAEGDRPDEAEVSARLREVTSALRDELPAAGRAAFDWLITGVRAHLTATEPRS
ncbi:hypothetical protein ACWKSP_39895 [Micromonosporaceae bacterium Da 78-11]